MADIFISYAKADRDLALKLSAFLEAEGWTVWWDRNLGPGDVYRDEIMTQLASARAVIVIWTGNSIHSDWVRAEAGRAKADGKLIPVKEPGLTYADIPLPFGEMHTENVANTALIKASVVGLLAKPTVAPSSISMIVKGARFQLLTWLGAIGGVLTIFTNLRGVLDLADWARWIVTHWHDWTQAFWHQVFGWIGLSVPRRIVPLLSFAAFTAMLVVGTRVKMAAERMVGQSTPSPEKLRRSLPRFLAFLSLYVLCLAVLYYFLPKYDPSEEVSVVITRAVLIIAWLIPYLIIMWTCGEPVQAGMTSLLFVLFYLLLVYIPAARNGQQPNYFIRAVGWRAIALYFIPAAGLMAMAALVPLKAVNRRLALLLLGTLALLVLNEVSKLELRPYVLAPR